MKDMECLRFETKFDDYLKRLLKEAAFNLKLTSWDQSLSDDNNALIVMLDQDHIDHCKKLLNQRKQKVIIAVNARRDFKLINDLKNELEKIFGFIDLTQEIDYNVPLLKNYSSLIYRSDSTVQLDKLAEDMEKLYEYTKSELTRVKDLHDRLVKVRVDKLKGVTITSKFMAGEKSGGEFFDMLQSDHEVLFLLAGTNHYVVSSFILAEMEVLKMSTPTTSLQSQCDHFEKMIIKHAEENGAEIHYCLVTVDLKTLQAQMKFKGDGFYNLNGESHQFGLQTKVKLRPGEKLHLLSEGALKNLNELNQKTTVPRFFKENTEKNTRDLINEFFFEVSRNKAGPFLNYDAIMAVIEIEAKTLYQI